MTLPSGRVNIGLSMPQGRERSPLAVDARSLLLVLGFHMAAKTYLAVDLGASSGRVLAGRFDGARLRLEEIHRFGNGPVHAAGHMYWDLLDLWQQIQQGLRAAHESFGESAVSVGVDTWGVDFGLLGRGDEPLGNPYCYRDARTEGMLDRAFELVGREAIFEATGLQFMQLNTLYQLLAMKEQHSPLLEMAETFLMMPDLFHWLLTGEKANEITDVSTTQFYDPQAGDWAKGLLEKLGIPTAMLGTLVTPGTKLGPLRGEVAAATGLKNLQVVLPGTHDTASAVVAVPVGPESDQGEAPDWCYISSGTWSLMGVETPLPVVTPRCSELNFTNEAGIGGTTRLLKNIAGLWLVQECRRVWSEAGTDYSWAALVAAAEKEPPLAHLFDPDHPSLVAPRDMPAAIKELCAAGGGESPKNRGAVIRAALESLAFRYRAVLGNLEELIGRRIETVHIVGGGAANKLLSQMAADACNRRVVAGPIEATAIGNVLVQAVADGVVSDIAQARQLVRASFEVEEFTPNEPAKWDEAWERYAKAAKG